MFFNNYLCVLCFKQTRSDLTVFSHSVGGIQTINNEFSKLMKPKVLPPGWSITGKGLTRIELEYNSENAPDERCVCNPFSKVHVAFFYDKNKNRLQVRTFPHMGHAVDAAQTELLNISAEALGTVQRSIEILANYIKFNSFFPNETILSINHSGLRILFHHIFPFELKFVPDAMVLHSLFIIIIH